MRTELLRECERKISSINMHLTHALFIGEQFLVDNSELLNANPESFTSAIYANNQYNRKFNYRLNRVRTAYISYQDFLFVSSFVFAYAVFESYLDDLFYLVGEIRNAKCKKLDNTLESLFICLGSVSSTHLDKYEMYTLDYVRWRRNCLVHAEGRPNNSLAKLIKTEGVKLNKFWQSKNLDFQALDFSAKSIGRFNEKELIETLTVIRDLAAKIDQQVTSLIKLDDVVSFTLSQFKIQFVDKIKQRTKSRAESMFANYIRIKFDINKKDLDFSKITF